MNGTPTISEQYAIIGDEKRPGNSRLTGDIALVVLARGPALFRPSALNEFWMRGFSEIVVIETAPLRYDPSPLVQDLPGLRILVCSSETTVGTWINLGAREVRSDRFLVLWDDQKLPDGTPASLLPRLLGDELAVVPRLTESSGRDLPCVQAFGLSAGRLKVLSLPTDEERVDTLFPSDFCAVYQRHKFLNTGGFETSLRSPFWQLLDWGLRSHLWGETLQVHRSFSVEYRLSAPVVNQTADPGSSVVYLRNLAIRHRGDHGELPWTRFWRHWSRSGQTLLPCLRQFSRERNWVKKHRYRYRTDARLLAELWGVV